MCNSFYIDSKVKDKLKILGFDNFEIKIGDNFPSDYVNVIVKDESLKIVKMKWFYSYGENRTNIYNCRIESAYQKPIFSRSITNRRCAIPASYFYEWGSFNQEKIKYKIFSKNYDTIFLAGIYDIFKIKDDFLSGFSILTTKSTGIIQKIHDRMPIIIDEKCLKDWLNPRITKDEVLKFADEKFYSDLNVTEISNSKPKQIEIQELI